MTTSHPHLSLSQVSSEAQSPSPPAPAHDTGGHCLSPTPIPLCVSPHPGSITEASWVCSDAFSWELKEESSPAKLPELG